MIKVPQYRLKSLSLPQRLIPLLPTESQDSWGPLEIIESNPPAKAASPRAGVQAGFEYLHKRISQLEKLLSHLIKT